MSRRMLTTAAAVLTLTISGGWVAYTFWPRTNPDLDWNPNYDLTSIPPEDIAPGTVVGTTPPEGWSHLIIKSLPRVHPDHRAGLNRLTIEKASWMFTAFTADVRLEQLSGRPRYHFRMIGLGLGSRTADGRDVVVTPETAADHGVALDLITREILTRGYATQHKAMIVVHGPTFALLDTPVWVRWSGKHRFVRYRYALLVDTATGNLDTLVWMLGPDGKLAENPEMGWLHPNTIDEAELFPDMDEIPGGLLPKSDSAFAVQGLPPSRRLIPIPVWLRDLASSMRFTPDGVKTLETELRKLIAE